VGEGKQAVLLLKKQHQKNFCSLGDWAFPDAALQQARTPPIPAAVKSFLRSFFLKKRLLS
jgi:hypothetical protein